MNNSTNCVEVKNVTKHYGSVEVLKNVSLQVKTGEFLVLVGPSGCGKSTLLRMIAGLEEITSGEIYIDGKLMNDVNPRNRDIGMVFQSYALYPHMNVFENMAFGLKMKNVPADEIKTRVHEAAELLRLTKYLERKPKELSGGQRQRVALGRAIVRKAKVFLFDEPLSNLDAKLRNKMRMEIKRLHQLLGNTMIYVTHDQIEATTMGDRIAVLNDGVIQQIGTTTELYMNPVNQFVAGFIGVPEMNFVHGKLAAEAGGSRFQSEDSSLVLNGLIAAAKIGADGVSVLGVRPEAVSLAPLNGSPSAVGAVPAVVEFVENLGSQNLVHCKVGKNAIRALAPLDRGHMIGDKVELSIASGKCVLFDQTTGRSVNANATPGYLG